LGFRVISRRFCLITCVARRAQWCTWTHLDIRRRGHELACHGIHDNAPDCNMASGCAIGQREALTAQGVEGRKHDSDPRTERR